MIRRTTRLAAVFATLVALAACTGGGSSSPSAGAVANPTVEPTTPAASPTSPGTSEPVATDSAAPETPALPVLDQAWATSELTDVTSGETFRIADLAGKTVIVETMAIWCSSCLAQQGDVYAALEELNSSQVAYILLDVDPNETASALADYRTQNGFTGVYAIAGRTTARALADEFGDQMLNPPSTPMVFIGSDGRVTLTDFGHKSVKEIVSLAREHGA